MAGLRAKVTVVSSRMGVGNARGAGLGRSQRRAKSLRPNDMSRRETRRLCAGHGRDFFRSGSGAIQSSRVNPRHGRWLACLGRDRRRDLTLRPPFHEPPEADELSAERTLNISETFSNETVISGASSSPRSNLRACAWARSKKPLTPSAVTRSLVGFFIFHSPKLLKLILKAAQ